MSLVAELEKLVSKYIAGVERVFKELRVLADDSKVLEVVNHAKRYFDDAKFFAEKADFKTALVSIAYCEGLLDALKALNFVDFSWHKNEETASNQ